MLQSYLYNSSNIILGGASTISVAENATNQVISEPTTITSKDAEGLLAIIETSAAVAGAGITVTLQQAYKSSKTFISATSTVAISAAGEALLAYSWLPGTNNLLLPVVRLVITTGAGASCTITSVNLCRRSF